MGETSYIHGTDPEEQRRLAALGALTDAAFLEYLQLDPAAAVLDVGSGLGNLARWVAQRTPQGEVWGVERSVEQLSRAPADVPNLHFVRADAHALPFPDNRFDLAYCRYVLEHVRDPAEVLREIRRVLKPGGKVFLQENNILVSAQDPDCPTFDLLWRRFADLQQRLGGDALVGKRLFGLLLQASFREVRLSIQPEVHYQGLPTFRAWVDNLIGNIRSGEARLLTEGLATHQEIATAIEELQRLIDEPTGSAFFYWNRAMALK